MPDEPLFTEDQAELYRSIIELLSTADGKATSSAKLTKELEWEPEDVNKAVRDLIAFGELELINISQAARVRLRKPSSSETQTRGQVTLGDTKPSLWHAYITERDGVGRTRARRLFDNRQAGENHLKQITFADSLTPVPGLSNVWCVSASGYDNHPKEYAVLRGEPVYSEAISPYP